MSYNEESPGDSDYGENTNKKDSRAVRPSARQKRPVKSARYKPAQKRKASGIGPAHRRHTIGAKRRKAHPATMKGAEDGSHAKIAIQMTGKRMPWQTLPYQILLSIFDYASYPLMSDTLYSTSSTKWLLDVALLCKSFAEPALSALYFSPPLSPPARARNLISHLRTQSDLSALNYKAKVKFLDMEANRTLVRKSDGQDPIDLAMLLALTPQLRGLTIRLISDNPRFHKGFYISGNRSIYQDPIFETLEKMEIRLKDWIWNFHLADTASGHEDAFTRLKFIHQSPSFQSLTSLAFMNYASTTGDRKPDAYVNVLGEAINLLPKLKRLQFSMSLIVSQQLMTVLPYNLEVLEIVSCSRLRSSSLRSFLVEKGHDLRELVLNHNQSLNLSFLSDLSSACPKLEVLKMDLIYFNTHFTFQDSNPKYDTLLALGERPAWPMTLRDLELYHLRKWKTNAAELFFSSLTESAESLPNLRQLKIKASLDESGWRDRVGFRDKWTQRLRQIFLGKPTPPNPHLKSFAAFKAFKAQESKSGNPKKVHMSRGSHRTMSDAITQRKAKLTRDTEHERDGGGQDSNIRQMATIDISSDSNSDTPLVKVRRSTRPKPPTEDLCPPPGSTPSKGTVRRHRRRRRDSDDSSSEDSAIDDDSLDSPQPRASRHEHEDLYIQGMCDVVDVLIDNLRPTEAQLHESDFLDDEPSGDEDWNGDDNIPGDGRYAW